MVRMPGELPGPTVAPVPTVTLPTVPAPPRVAPAARLTLPMVPLTARRPELTSTLTLGALTPVAILRAPLPCFSRVVLPVPVTTGAAVNSTVFAPRLSFAVVLAATSSLTGVVLPASQRTVAPLATARVAPVGKAPDSRPTVEPAPASMRMSPLKRLAPEPMTQTPTPSMAREASGLLPAASVGAKRLVPVLLAVSVRAGVEPVVAILESDVNSSVPAPVAAMPAEPPIVKLRAVLVLLDPLNSRVAPEDSVRLEGTLRSLAPSELLLSERKAALMTAVEPEAAVAPVKKFGVASSSVPPSALERPPVPVRTVLTVVEPVVVTDEASGPPRMVPPEATVMAFETPKPAKLSVAPLATVTAPEPREPTLPTTSVPALTAVPPPKVLAKLRVKVPLVALISEPLVPASRPMKVPSLTVRAVVPRLIVPSVRVPTEAVAPLRFSVPVVRVVTVATPPTVVVPPLTVVTVAAPVIVLVPPVTEEEESEPREFVPAVMAPVSRPETVTELPTEPVIEPAETVPAVTLPVRSPVTVTVPPVTLPVSEPALTVPAVTLPERRFVTVTAPPEIAPVSEPALTVPPETAAPSAPTTVTVPSATPPVMSASLPKRVLPAPARLARVILPVEAVKLSAFAAVPALVTAPVIDRVSPEIVAVAEASSARVAARL